MQYVQVGDIVRVKLPFSEVCMHLRVAGEMLAGQEMYVQLVSGYNNEVMAQILHDDGSKCSFPILPGEAGIYTEYTEPKYYTYPVPEKFVERIPIDITEEGEGIFDDDLAGWDDPDEDDGKISQRERI